MDDLDFLVRRALDEGLTARRAHTSPLNALDGLPWALTGEKPDRAPHTIHQLVLHLIYWQEYACALLRDEAASPPEHAEMGWPGSERPADAEAWEQAIARFARGLDEVRTYVRSAELTRLVKGEGQVSRLDLLMALVLHNSHHLGQVIQLRRMLGVWPPPGGGDTW